MRRLHSLIALAVTMALAAPAGANPGAPSFAPALYGDGALWGTKAAAALPAPTGRNRQSFDKLFVFVNGAPGQLPVAEAAPGNPAYNGGRWFTHTVMWLPEGMAAHDPLPVLMSYDEVAVHYGLGHLAIVAGSPAGGPPPYFECPMLPVR